MEIDQVYKAPSIPKLNRRNIKSTLISGAIKPGVELKKTKFSFIKPLVKLIPDSLVPIKEEENKGSLVKNIQSGIGIQKLLEQSNKILSQIKQQLSLDFLSRINEEKKELAENKKRIAAEKVKDKEKKIESGGKGLLGGTLSAVVAPAKSIFQKLLDFFSIVLTGILVNNAFKWLQKPENQKKLQDFFNFLKEYWQELLIVFGAVKLLGLVRKIWKVANAIKGLIDFFKSKPKLPCNCPKSPAQQGGLPDCEPVKDCVDSLIRDPKKGPGFLQSLAQALLTTAAFAPFLLLLKKQPQTAQPQQQKQTPVQQPTPSPAKAAPVLASGTSPASYGPLVEAGIQKARSENRSQSIPTPDGGRINIDRRGRVTRIQTGAEVAEGEKKSKNLLNLFGLTNLPATLWGPGRRSGMGSAPKGTGLVTGVKAAPGAGLERQFAGEVARRGTTKAAEQVTANVIQQGAKNSVINNIFRTRVTSSVQKIFKNENQKFNLNDRNTLDNLLNVAKKDPQGLVQYFKSNVDPKTRNIALEIWKQLGRKVPDGVPALFSEGGTVSLKNLNQYVVSREKGGTIPKISLFAGGGTVGGPGRMGIDSVPAMIASGAKTMMGGANALLAPGEEVIKTSSAMLFRPLLKDINDNAGRLWQAFTNAVRKQNLNETIVTDLIGQFGQIIKEFKDLLDKESSELRQKGRKKPPGSGGGTLRPSFGGGNPIGKIDKGVGGLIQDVGGMIGRNKGSQTGIPGGGWIGEQTGRREANDRYQDFTNSIRNLLDRSKTNTSAPNINVQKPVNLTQNVINPQIEKTILGDKNVYVIPVPISTESSKLFSSKSSGGNISVINLPRKVVNLSKPSQPKSAPSSSSGTSLPSISPIDESNDYIFTTPSMYGILVV